MRFLTRLLLLGTASGVMGLMAGCGLFGGDDDVLPPKKLIKFEATFPIKKAWSTKLGKGSEFLRVALSPAGDGKRRQDGHEEDDNLAAWVRKGTTFALTLPPK